MREDLESLFEQIIPENFPNVGKETGIKVQEAQRTPFKINKNNLTARHIIVKLAKYKDKEKILKAARDKQSLTCKDRHIRLVADLPTETWQARREWQEIFKLLNRKKYAAKNPLSSKAVIQSRRRDKSFPRQTKTKGVHDH